MTTRRQDHANTGGCGEFSTLIQPFIDNELSEIEQEHVGAHLENCDACLHVVQQQQQVRSLLRAAGPETTPASLRSKILTALDQVDQETGKDTDEAVASMSASAPMHPSSTESVPTTLLVFKRLSQAFLPAAAAALVWAYLDQPDELSRPVAKTASPELSNTHEATPPSSLANNKKSSMRPSSKLVRPEQHPSKPSNHFFSGQDPLDAQPELSHLASTRAESKPMPIQAVAPLALPDGRELLPKEVVPVAAQKTAKDPAHHATVRYRDRDGRSQIQDEQRRSSKSRPKGHRRLFREREYFLSREWDGRPRVEFEVGEVHHSLVNEAYPDVRPQLTGNEEDFVPLLMVGDALHNAHR